MKREPASSPEMDVDVIVADHHRVVADGVAALVSPYVRSVDTAYTAAVLLATARPGVVIVGDIDLPDMPGMGPMTMLQARDPSTRFIVLTAHAEPTVVQDAVRYGAWAYVLKQSPRNELIDALREVVAGHRYVSPRLMSVMVNAPHLRFRLTARQQQVLERMACGMRAADIAKDLGISVRTVESHRQSLLELFRVHSAVALVREALRAGVITDQGPAGPRDGKPMG